MKKLAIIAGSGHLPRHVYDACKEQKIDCCIVALEEEISFDLYKGINLNKFKTHSISRILNFLKQEGVTHVTLAGKVIRTEIPKLLLDLKGAKLFALIIRNGLNDNAVLNTIIKFIESEGFEIVPPEKIANKIIIHKGCITKIRPDYSAQQDIKKGLKILYGIATYDVGQSLIIQNGLVLGIEAAEGTDELIRRCGEIKQKDEIYPIIIKVSKPLQDRRADLPCVGPMTIEKAFKYGIRGIAVEAESTIILNEKETLKLANKYKIFIVGI
jgi:UDP-2,3-diacylglucosamine hydrolase